mgnify:CR=1 FL=1
MDVPPKIWPVLLYGGGVMKKLTPGRSRHESLVQGFENNGNVYRSSVKLKKELHHDLNYMGKVKHVILAIYGVEDRIEFIVGDYFEVVKYIRPDVIFLSPPWGGPEYLNQEIFDLSKMGNLDGDRIFKNAFDRTENVAYFVPRNTDTAQLAKLAGPEGRVEVRVFEFLILNVFFNFELFFEF